MSMRPHGYPALGRLTSTAAVSVAAWLGAGLAPVEKFGELDGPERLMLALGAGALWLLILGRLPAVLAPLVLPDRGIRPEDRRRLTARVSLVGFGVAASALVPFLSYDWSRALWRSRYLLVAHLLVSAALFALLFLRRDLARLPLRRLSTGAGIAWSLGATAALLVLCGESILDWTLFQELRFVPDHASVPELAGNFTINALLVASALGFAWGLTDRLGLAVLATGSSYVGLSFCNALKLANLKEPVRVLDLFYLGELGTVLRDFLPGVWLVPAGALGLILFAAALRAAHPFAGVEHHARRTVLTLAGLAVFALIGRLAALEPEARKPWLPWQSNASWDARQASLAEGMLFHFLGEALTSRVPTPPDYSAAELTRIRVAVASPEAEPWAPWTGSVVVLMVESWMDPAELPVAFTSDPTPTLHRLMAEHSSGTVRSPVFGSGSANAEFELLTGLSMRFLPRGSLPYRQYVRHELPALPRLFRDQGFRSVSILVDPPSYFDRPATHPRLGFEQSIWLHEEPDVERDASGRWASDGAVVDRILTTLEDESPAFVFAFTNATHAPYGTAVTSTEDDGLLEVLGAPSREVGQELRGYARALREMDRAIEELVRGLEQRERPSVLLVVGDHRPPLESFTALGIHVGFEGREARHGVPALLWTSFASDRQELEGSQSELGLTLLETLGFEPGPLLRAAKRAHSSPRAEADFALVQHDVLFGAPHQNWFLAPRAASR